MSSTETTASETESSTAFGPLNLLAAEGYRVVR